MVAVAHVEDAPSGLVRIPGTWAAFVELLEAKGDAPWPKLSYCDGEIEIEMAPGRRHETAKKRIAQLLEVYCEVAGVRLRAWGSTTLKRDEAAGAEPDESYALAGQEERPDLVIEVIVSSGGLEKLRVHAALGVPEVWFWSERDGLTVHVLEGDEYEETASSRLLPELDLALLVSHLLEDEDIIARAAYRNALERNLG